MSASRHKARGIACAVWIVIALLSGSCSEETTAPTCGSERIAVLEGYVIVAGRPVEVAVGARQFRNPGVIVATTRSNASGWYHLDVVPGAYWLLLHDTDGGPSNRDTVHAVAGCQRVDIRRGHLTIRIGTPPQIEGRRISCQLRSNRRSRYADARVQQGHLEFEFPNLQSDVYRINIENEFWLPESHDFESAARVAVPTTHAIVYESNLNGYASISGTIRGSWQQANGSRPQVHAYAPDIDMDQISSASLADDGSYTLDFLLARPAKVMVNFHGIVQWMGGDSFETATIYNLQPGEHLQDVSLVEGGILCHLEGPGYITNHRANFSLRDSRGRTYEIENYDSSPVLLCNLPPENYTLHVFGYCDYDGEPWADQWYDGVDSLAVATVIPVAAGQLVPITVHLVAGATIDGRILSFDGGSAYAGVRMFDQQGVPLCDFGGATRAGVFVFRGLNNGDYKLAARTITGVNWWYPGTTDLDSARVIEIRDRTSVSGIEWRLPPENAGSPP